MSLLPLSKCYYTMSERILSHAKADFISCQTLLSPYIFVCYLCIMLLYQYITRFLWLNNFLEMFSSHVILHRCWFVRLWELLFIQVNFDCTIVVTTVHKLAIQVSMLIQNCVRTNVCSIYSCLLSKLGWT